MTMISTVIKLSSAEIFGFSSVHNRQERSVGAYNAKWRPFQICVAVARFKLLTAYLTYVTLPFFLHYATSPVGQDLFIIGTLRQHSNTPPSVGLLGTSDQPDPETSTLQHTTLTTDKHSCPWRDSNPQSQQASGRRPTP